ncbi:MAG: hypothetical protein EOO99_00475 [Pedobacter sp.]|nr:MAG: hypothetical protein EOO99_00475 [Pedobacter sp.]
MEGELNKEAKPVKKFHWSPWMSVAAMVMVIITIAITIGINRTLESDEIVQKSNEYEDQQVHFAGLIEEKRDSLQFFSASNPELYKKFVADLKQLDNDYIKLQEQLKTSPNQEVVVKAMIKNLEIRADMLSQQLQIFNQVKAIKQENIL